ncbi:GDP-D-glucose phosphorylase 1, partial [Orchesella cincta]
EPKWRTGIQSEGSFSAKIGAMWETPKEKVYENDRAIEDSNNNNVSKKQRGEVKLDFTLRAFWDLAMDSGLFRYKLRENSLPTKVLPGKFNYVAQLNPDRAEKRRKPQEIECVNQPFSPGQFNFNKIDSKEVLFRLQPWYSGDSSEHLLLINVSPLEYGHVLLTPSRNKNYPQKLTSSGLRLSLELVLLNNSPNFRLGFNSLCGFASVNHEHYHAYYLAHRLFLEYAELERVIGDCYRIKDPEYPPGFCFVLKDHPVSEEGLNKLVSSVMTLGKYLQENNVAHNLFVVRGSTKNVQGHFDSVRVFVWARESSFGAKGCDAFNPALCELAGHFPIKSEKTNEAAYESLTEEFILNTLHAICDKPFQQVKTRIIANFIENLF